ncbi:transcriptional repressor LexA [Glacieibacterium megasporae]|uniref:transcriptional repressor LexA n=1 Tax=Glacieibacterium megasporae TaxID=2835787 RepID=UPI001C1E7D0E|nr:transcriptional repressor LexA [Polymorphobacter megasporae]UAJ09203.1 transcriptional repressor LexA [Polymorphobacter megasporae]
MLTRKQHDLLTFINGRLNESGVSPSFEEMKEALALKSKSGVHRLINALEERAFIRRLPNRARALEVLRMPDAVQRAVSAPKGEVVHADFRKRVAPVAPANDIVTLALHGRIAAGQPIEAFEDDRLLSVPAALLGPGDHYALEVSGDSMVDAGILDGDYALVRRCDTARDGDIVVALVDGNDATLKILKHAKGMVELEPANTMYSTQRYLPSRVRVQGKLAGLLRRYA